MASLQRSLASSMAADSSLMNAPSVMFDTNWKQMSLITKKKKRKEKITNEIISELTWRP